MWYVVFPLNDQLLLLQYSNNGFVAYCDYKSQLYFISRTFFSLRLLLWLWN